MSRRNAGPDPLEGIGLAMEDVAITAATVYAGIAVADLDVEDPGWAAVSRVAAGMFGHDDSEDEGRPDDTTTTIPLVQLASQIRRAFARAHNAEGEIPEWEELAPRFRLGWEGVTRHLSNVFNMDETEARRLGQHEQRMIQFMKDLAAKRATTPRE